MILELLIGNIYCLYTLLFCRNIWEILTADSLLSAVDFLSTRVAGRPLDIVNGVEATRRYLYYFALVAAYAATRLATADLAGVLTTRVFMLLANPFLMYAVCRHAHWFEQFYQYARGRTIKAVKSITCNVLAWSTNTLCREVLQCEPMISRKETAAVVDAYTYEHIDLLIRVFVAVNIINSLGATSKSLSGFVKMMYNRGKVVPIRHEATYQDPYPDVTDPREKIRRLVMSRRWHLFYNPRVLETIIEIYETGNSDRMQKWCRGMLKWIGTIIAQFFTVWTLCYHVPNALAMLATSLIILYTRQTTPRERLFNLCWKIAGAGVYMWSSSPVLGAAVAELGDLAWNRGTWWLGNKLQRRSEYWGGVLNHVHSYDAHLTFYAVMVYVAARIFGWSALLFVVMIPTLQHQWMITAYLFTICSGVAFWHLATLGVIMYIGVNLYHRDTAPKHKIDPVMIQSYIFEAKPRPPALLIMENYRG